MNALTRLLRAAAPGIAGTGVGSVLVLAVLAGGASFAAAAISREDAWAQTTALHRELTDGGITAGAVTARADYADLQAALAAANGRPARLTAPQLDAPGAALQGQLSGLGVPVSSDPKAAWSGLRTTENVVAVDPPTAPAAATFPIHLQLDLRDTLEDHATLVKGAFPQQATPAAGPGRPATFEIAVSQTTADTLHLSVNESLSMAANPALHVPPIEAKVSGIIRPKQPTEQFWAYDPLTTAPNLVAPVDHPAYWEAQAFVGSDELTGFVAAFALQGIALTYSAPLDLTNVTSGGADGLAAALTEEESEAAGLQIAAGDPPGSATATVALSSDGGPLAVLQSFLQQRRAVDAVLSLVVGSLAALGAAVLLLCVRLLAERRSAEFVLLRTRGASRRQLARLGARAGAVAALCGVAGALPAFAVVPGPVDLGSTLWFVGPIAVVALLGPAVAAARSGPSPGKKTKISDVGRPVRTARRRRRARQVIANGALILVCLGSVAALREYGAGNGNALAALAPFLLAVPVASAVYWLFPPTARLMAGIAADRRGAVPFVALARAARGSSAALLPSLALVLALSVVAIGSMVHDSVLSGQVRASWAKTGADALVTADRTSTGFSPAAVRALETVPGVDRSAAATVIDTNGFSLASAQGDAPPDTLMLIVDPAQYRALTAGTPAAQLPAGLDAGAGGRSAAAAPIVVSSAVGATLGSGASTMTLYQANLMVQPVATVAATAALPGVTDFVIVPDSLFSTHGVALAAPNVLLLDGPVDIPALTATAAKLAPGSTIQSRAAALSVLTSAPFQAVTVRLSELSILAAVLLAFVALFAAATLGAAARERTLAYLSTMGLNRGQGVRVVVLENLPALAAALVGGAACTVAISTLVGSSVDLGVFTGTSGSFPLRADPGTLLVAAGVIAATGLLAVGGHAAGAHRRGMNAALRIGEL